MLKTSNVSGFFFHVERDLDKNYDTRNDLTVFVPHDGDWACTLEGSPDEEARCFVVKDTEELKRVIAGLTLALREIEKRNDTHGDAYPPGYYFDTFCGDK